MGIRGAKPKPATHLTVVSNKGKRKPPGVRAKPGMPKPPAFLDPVAKAEWDRIVPELNVLGLVSPCDATILGAYCCAYSFWQQAEAELAKANLDPTFRITVNPQKVHCLVTVTNAARVQVARLAETLGMSPSSRSRIPAIKPEDDDEDPSSKYLD